jgi:hypothetical protein
MLNGDEKMAGPTGLEPATSSVTGKRDNQLHYGPAPQALLHPNISP